MDPYAVARDLQGSREKLRSVMMRDADGSVDADVFPRSATMRFLLNPQRRGWATMLLGGLGSFVLSRRSRRKRDDESSRRPGLTRSIGNLLGGVLRR